MKTKNKLSNLHIHNVEPKHIDLTKDITLTCLTALLSRLKSQIKHSEQNCPEQIIIWKKKYNDTRKVIRTVKEILN